MYVQKILEKYVVKDCTTLQLSLSKALTKQWFLNHLWCQIVYILKDTETWKNYECTYLVVAILCMLSMRHKPTF